MIDINLLRPDKGGDINAVKQSQRKRAGDAGVQIVDDVLLLDQQWIKAIFDLAQVNKDINQIAKRLAPFGKSRTMDSKEALLILAEKDDLGKQKDTLSKLANDKEIELNSKLGLIGNIVHSSCVDSNDEKNNLKVKMWWPEGRSEDGEKERRKAIVDGKGVPGLYAHNEVLERIGGYDPVRGTKVSGHRGYFLTGPGVDLNLALMQYGLDFLEKRGYTKMWTPFFMKRSVMAKTAQLSEFDEALYTVKGEEGEENYLIATSEQPISAYHQGEWFTGPEDLPKKYAGTSTCFRKEAGAHGRDTWGIFRVHQFEKIEQFILCEPSKSWEMHEEMLKCAEEFYQSLCIPYHVVSIVSGALNNAAAKKYDLEAYFPFQGEYKELVSCSNCTDYQSRELEIRYGVKKVTIILN
jgi:seryl-tRNA synthetase